MNMMEILDFVVKLDAKEARQAQQLIDAHLRDLEGATHLPHSGIPGHEGARDECPVCHGEVGHRINCPRGIAFDHREGLELQAGLEESVRRETARLDADQQLSTS